MRRPPPQPWPYGNTVGPSGGGFSNPAYFFQNVNLQCAANTQFSHQPRSFPQAVFQNPRVVQLQNTFIGSAGFSATVPLSNTPITLDTVESTAAKVHQDLVLTGESISAWKVSQNVLVALKVDSWSLLGFSLQEVPTINRLLLIEGKVNAFIHCFVCAHNITSLYELEVSLCKNMGVGQFKELGLGPLLHHPLIKNYFAIPSDSTKIFEITSEEIILSLQEFIGKSKKVISAEEFLQFLAKKKSVPRNEKIGVLIRNLGFYVHHIQEASKAEYTLLRKKINESGFKHNNTEVSGQICESQNPKLAFEKQILNKRFNRISNCVKSFSSTWIDSDDKHIYLTSDDDEDSKEDDALGDKLSAVKGCGQPINSCPYPSKSEEMMRLGLKPVDGYKSSAAVGRIRNKAGTNTSRMKRKLEKIASFSSSSKFQKKGEADDMETEGQMCDLTLSNGDMEKFVATWKMVCGKQTVAEVFDVMLNFYSKKNKQKDKARKLVSSYPMIGLLNVAVSSMKNGMHSSMYDTFQTLNAADSTDFGEMIDVGPTFKVGNPAIAIDNGYSATHDDIMKKILNYFEKHKIPQKQGDLPPEKLLAALKRFYDCEMWLIAQFNVEKFCSLGHGNFYDFLGKYFHILTPDIRDFLTDGHFLEPSMEVCLNQQQLGVMLLQAEMNLMAKVDTSNFDTLSLLTKQFPLASFHSIGVDPQKRFQELIIEHTKSSKSSCFFFSICLIGEKLKPNVSLYKGNSSLDLEVMETEVAQPYTFRRTSKDAVECLLKTPMMADLLYWSHWDLLYAPSLGPLPEFLLNKVNSNNLLCIATVGGKFVRIDHNATADEFLEAFLQHSPFLLALKLLSLICLYRGTSNAPVALLKCYAQKAVDVIMQNCADSAEINVGKLSFVPEQVVRTECSDCSCFRADGIKEYNENCKRSTLCADSCGVNYAINSLSRTILECLKYLPSEFRSFAAEIFLSGLRSATNQAPAVILNQCSRIEERIMLHDIGISLGVTEFVTDHNQFSSSAVPDLSMPSKTIEKLPSSFCSASAFNHTNSELVSEVCITGKTHDFSVGDRKSRLLSGANSGSSSMVTEFGEIDERRALCEETATAIKISENQVLRDATTIVELIRQEEFGLRSNSNKSEDSLLKRQHARLGRALHCLSQELYSHDSHFILELVQNADDNMYPDNVEPELLFILCETGIVVLNNEVGFSAENIRALCDVGNSTKKKSGGGYIGEKGIGFKSVFRVTDAPEIHSNGFHVKFDISEGQIGFVLPTLVPPCDAGTLQQYLYGEGYQGSDKSWNTCILLPFRPQSKAGTGINSIISMFSDLHPSLLLFLNRLHCIKFKNMLSGRFIVMRKEGLHDGIIKISHGEDVVSWLVVSKKLQPCIIRADVEATDISMAFALQESENGEYKPVLRNQPVFSFLPLRNYGLKFILQGDFVLPSSREEVDADSAWNQWLLTEFPALFVSAEHAFCKLPCFVENPAKAVTIFMSFVPLVGEVHGFFSRFPQMIISLLRISCCLLQDNPDLTWALPCRVLRGWNEQTRLLLSDCLLQRHLGLVYLHKDVKLSDAIAMALGIRDYGPKILVEIMESVCRSPEVLKSLGIDWLSACLSAVYSLLPINLPQNTFLNDELESDIVNDLKNIPFIPLSDDSYGSVADGPIWLPCDALNTGSKKEYHPEDFSYLYNKLRIVAPQLFAPKTQNVCSIGDIKSDIVMKMLLKIGVQPLSAHEVVKSHILIALSNKLVYGDCDLMIEYLTFIMLHLQSDCPSCRTERDEIMAEIRKLPILLTTNHGYKCPSMEPIHFGREYGNPVDTSFLFDVEDVGWVEVDPLYLNHPSDLSLSSKLQKWRAFFLNLGVTDFVQVTFIDKNAEDSLSDGTKNIASFNSAISYVRDYESPELVSLLSIFASKNLRAKCIYLLEILDKLWDDGYSVYTSSFIISKIDGAKKPIISSFVNSIRKFSWIASTRDEYLHQPSEVYYDCEQVSSVLGKLGPYASPKINSKALVNAIGFKMEVSIDDAVEILQFWRTSKPPFVTSIAQMLKLYTLIASGIAASSSEFINKLVSSCFIFVPFISNCERSAPVSGTFLLPEEVHWRDPTGCVDKTKELMLSSKSNKGHHILCDSLETIYPSLRDFFVKVCGVPDSPSFSSYFKILRQLSAVALPPQAAHKVFKVLVKWSEDLKSGLVSLEQISELKDIFMKLEYTVLPTAQDKWVSLHPSFGLICWSDDDELKNQFKHSDGVHLLQFGELNAEENAMLHGVLATFFRIIGIPALSKIVSREAIFYGKEENKDKVSLVNWVMPYAQRYIHKLHIDAYLKLKHAHAEKLGQLRVVVVGKLFYKYTLRGRDSVSKQQFECDCVLQDNILYTCQTADAHSMFLELSRFFFNGSCELHFANFLHMVTTMAQSGSTLEQIEYFAVNSQKIPKLPDDESMWSILSIREVDDRRTTCEDLEHGPSKSSHRKPGISTCWPPTDWKTAPGFQNPRTRNLPALPCDPSQVTLSKPADDEIKFDPASIEITKNWTLEEGLIQEASPVLQDLEATSWFHEKDVAFRRNQPEKERITKHALQERYATGRLGEMLAYKYFTEKLGSTDVSWVNEGIESGFPYDLVVDEKDKRQYIEVKSTRCANKGWFDITTREWNFAVEQGESFSIAHVAILSQDKAIVTVFKNPYKLCQKNVMGLALVMSKS